MADFPQWMSPKTAALYRSCSRRTVCEDLKNGLPHVKIRGSVLINRLEYDKWLLSFSVENHAVNDLVDQVIGDL
jgi:excisionase family DNA binding protein